MMTNELDDIPARLGRSAGLAMLRLLESLTGDPVEARRIFSASALLIDVTPGKPISEEGAFPNFQPSERLCKTCHEPLQGHRNALTHPGKCRRARHAERQRQAYANRRQRAGAPRLPCKRESCTVLFVPAREGQLYCSRDCATTARAPMAGGHPQGRAGRPRLLVTTETVLVALRAGGPLDERSVAEAFGLRTIEGVHVVAAALDQLVRQGHARVIVSAEGPDNYEATIQCNE